MGVISAAENDAAEASGYVQECKSGIYITIQKALSIFTLAI